MRRTGFALLLVLAAVPAAAQQATATLNANLPAIARLSLSTNSISFPDADPDLFPIVGSSPAAVTVTAKARASYGSTITLTVEAGDDLRSGLDTIAVSNISWRATGEGFVDGTLSRTSPQVLGMWAASGVRTGDQSFLFTNRWTYPTGIFTVTLTYTLSAP